MQRLFCSTSSTLIQQPHHIPVMAKEVLNFLKPKSKEIIIDMTFGAGGHTKEILKAEPDVKIIAVDRDPLAHSYAENLAREFPEQVFPLLGKFSDLPALLKSAGITKKNSIDGILFDFGCSSMQFDLPERGFSISKNGPLDMRMDGQNNPEIPTTAQILSNIMEEDLYKILKYYGEEKQARKIARAIIEARYMFKNLTTTEELADLVDAVINQDDHFSSSSSSSSSSSKHAATKTFQALRIFVNNELNEINYGLILAGHYLKLGGKLITITFHSLEDKIVKRHLFGNLIGNCANPLPLKFSNYNYNLPLDELKNLMENSWIMLHKHVIVPSYEEIDQNNRSRSAKLRAAVKIK